MVSFSDNRMRAAVDGLSSEGYVGVHQFPQQSPARRETNHACGILYRTQNVANRATRNGCRAHSSVVTNNVVQGVTAAHDKKRSKRVCTDQYRAQARHVKVLLRVFDFLQQYSFVSVSRSIVH